MPYLQFGFLFSVEHVSFSLDVDAKAICALSVYTATECRFQNAELALLQDLFKATIAFV